MELIKVLYRNETILAFYGADISSEDTDTILSENPLSLFSTNTIEIPALNKDSSNLLMPHHVVVEDGVARILTGDELASAESAEIELTALNHLRRERDKKLLKTDWWANSDLTMTEEQTVYRQRLRDITDEFSSVESVEWPTLGQEVWPTPPFQPGT
jgi:hypothetical protein